MLLQSLASFFLLNLVSANMNGQVTQLLQYVESSAGGFIVGAGVGEFTVQVSGNNTSVTPFGALGADQTDFLTILGNDVFPVSPIGETHFQYVLGFNASITATSPGPLGTNNDPMYGCLTVGVTNNNEYGNLFMLTNTKVYAMTYLINPDGITYWAIPVANRMIGSLDLYTIVIKRAELRVLFRINNVDVVELPGYCGIDDSFKIVGTTSTKSAHGEKVGCEPVLIDAMLATAQNFIFLGAFAVNSFTLNRGFCQGTTYSMCTENVSQAFRNRCQYSSGTVPFTATYLAQIDRLEAFYMDKTDRCDGSSSSSSERHHNWYSQPLKAEELA